MNTYPSQAPSYYAQPPVIYNQGGYYNPTYTQPVNNWGQHITWWRRLNKAATVIAWAFLAVFAITLIVGARVDGKRTPEAIELWNLCNQIVKIQAIIFGVWVIFAIIIYFATTKRRKAGIVSPIEKIAHISCIIALFISIIGAVIGVFLIIGILSGLGSQRRVIYY